MSLLVTIVTPTYNHAQFLPMTIENILGQTYQHIEYMIFDADSQDKTPHILDQYASYDIHIESEEGLGQAAAINRGWSMATGDIVAWLNSDDTYASEETVEIAVRYFEEHPDAYWIYGDAIPIDEQGESYPFRDNAEPWSYQRLLERNFITQPTVFLRKSVVEGLGYISEDLNYIFDYEYWLRIGQHYAGHYVPDIKAKVTRTRSTKTASGGFPRLQELETVVKQYGGTDLPKSSQAEWVTSAFDESFKQMRKGKFGQAMQELKKVSRYPKSLPRGLIKFLIYSFVPLSLETRLRQWFVR